MAQDRVYKVLICDPIGLRRGRDGKPDVSEVKTFIECRGATFHTLDQAETGALPADKIHFFYLPHLSQETEILQISGRGQYDAVIAAATFLPQASEFKFGGVRIGAGTGNMACKCWGGANGVGGIAPLMNTPSFNSRATAQMVMKALLRFLPDLPFDELHRLSIEGHFDTAKNLGDFPTEKLEGKTMAVLGYGNIGREVALLAGAFGMIVKIYAREKYREWIESEGFVFAQTPQSAAQDAHVLSVHVGLGTQDQSTGKFANANLVNADVLNHLAHGATLINFDRGECVDVTALDTAMADGLVRFAAIDADIFQIENGNARGPLAPYLHLAKLYDDRILLLPHVAADTCHTSRVEGAKQAVDQIISCLMHRRVTNLKGDVPPGFNDSGQHTVKGVGKVEPSVILDILADDIKMQQINDALSKMQQGWNALQSLSADERRKVIMSEGDNLVTSISIYTTLVQRALW